MEFQTYYELNKLYADYAATVDSRDWDGWVDYFLEDCEYKLQPRENHERGFPLSTMWFISRKMLKDRASGIRETLFHDPSSQRHVVGAPRVVSHQGDLIESEANYAVFRTKYDGQSTVFNVGRYIDRIRITPEGLKFESRHCIYDSEMIPNSIIYPI